MRKGDESGHLLGNRQVWIETVEGQLAGGRDGCHLLGNRQVWIETFSHPRKTLMDIVTCWETGRCGLKRRITLHIRTITRSPVGKPAGVD